MRRSWFLIVLPLSAVVMFGAATYHVAKEQKDLPRLAPPVVPARSTYGSAVAATGLVEAETENIAVGSPLEGVVVEVFTPSEKVGQHVAAGDPLFRVDDRHLRAQLALAEAKVVAAEAQLSKLIAQPRPEELPPAEAKVRSAEAAADRARDELERAENLRRRGAVTEQEVIIKRLTYEGAHQQHAQAAAEYDLLKAGAWEPDKAIARAAVQQARADAGQIRTEIERALVRAPVSGEVLQVNVRAGEFVSARVATPLVVLGSVQRLHVRVDVDEHDIPRFQRSAVASAYARGDGEHAIPLAFRRVEPLVIAKRSLSGDNTERIDTRVLPVIYVVDASAAPLFVGQQVDVFIESASTASNRSSVSLARDR